VVVASVTATDRRIIQIMSSTDTPTNERMIQIMMTHGSFTKHASESAPSFCCFVRRLKPTNQQKDDTNYDACFVKGSMRHNLYHPFVGPCVVY